MPFALISWLEFSAVLKKDTQGRPESPRQILLDFVRKRETERERRGRKRERRGEGGERETEKFDIY